MSLSHFHNGGQTQNVSCTSLLLSNSTGFSDSSIRNPQGLADLDSLNGPRDSISKLVVGFCVIFEKGRVLGVGTHLRSLSNYLGLISSRHFVVNEHDSLVSHHYFFLSANMCFISLSQLLKQFLACNSVSSPNSFERGFVASLDLL